MTHRLINRLRSLEARRGVNDTVAIGTVPSNWEAEESDSFLHRLAIEAGAVEPFDVWPIAGERQADARLMFLGSFSELLATIARESSRIGMNRQEERP